MTTLSKLNAAMSLGNLAVARHPFAALRASRINLRVQIFAQHLMHALRSAVIGLDGRDSLRVSQSGIGQDRQNMRPITLGTARRTEPRVWIPGRGLGDDFTPEIALALTTLYDPMPGTSAVVDAGAASSKTNTVAAAAD